MIRDERGFTLAELLVAVAVLAFIMAGVLALQRQGQTAYLMGAARVEVQQNARVALDVMMNELRAAQSMTTVTNCNNATNGTTDITFVDQGGTSHQYQLVGTILQRDGAALIGGVQALRIWCYDGAEALTATASSVRTVLVSITTQTEKGVASYSAANQHAVVEGRVRLRNLL